MKTSHAKHPLYPVLLFARAAQVGLAIYFVVRAEFRIVPLFLMIQLGIFATCELSYLLLVWLSNFLKNRHERTKRAAMAESLERQRQADFKRAQQEATDKYLEVGDFYQWRREQEAESRRKRPASRR